MKQTNKEAVQYLAITDVYRYDSSERTVEALVKGGFITPDPMSRPELIVEQVKEWHRGNPVHMFEDAAGWNTAGWETVLDEKTDIMMRRDIFKALKILADEAGM